MIDQLRFFDPPIFSDDDDDDDISPRYLDSDEWDSSLEELYSISDEEFQEYELRRRAKRKKHERETSVFDSKRIYLLSAEKFYSAFPSEDDVSIATNNLILLKNWSVNIFTAVLTRSIGQELPHLVLENILRCLQSWPYRVLSLKIGFIAKTKNFIDVERIRMRELYAALIDIHSLMFEILFKNHCTSSMVYLQDHFRKLFDVAMRKMTLLDDFHTWLQGSDDEEETMHDFMSGICYKKLIKASGRDFDYFLHLGDSFSYLDGTRIALCVPGGVKEGCVKIYDVITGHCLLVHSIDIMDIPLGIALDGNQLTIVLKRDLLLLLEIYDIDADKSKPVARRTKPIATLYIGKTKTESFEKLLVVYIEGRRHLVAQKYDSIILIDLGTGSSLLPKVTKVYYILPLLSLFLLLFIMVKFCFPYCRVNEIC